MIEFTCEAIWFWTFVCWKIFNQFQFWYLWLVCSYFLFLPSSVFEGCIFLKVCPFLLSFPFYWNIAACYNLMILCISVVSTVTSPFSFWILLIWILSLFFLDESGWRFINFVYLLKEPAFIFKKILFIWLLYVLVAARVLQPSLCRSIQDL